MHGESLEITLTVLLIFKFIQRLDIFYEMAFNIDLDFHDVNFNIRTKKYLIHQKQMNHSIFNQGQIFVFPLLGGPLNLSTRNYFFFLIRLDKIWITAFLTDLQYKSSGQISLASDMNLNT